MVNKWLNYIQTWCFPSTCILCGLPGQDDLDLCTDCHSELNFLTNACSQCALPLSAAPEASVCGRCQQQPPHYDRAISLFHYQPPASKLIQSLKYGQKLQHARILGTLLAGKIRHQTRELPEALIPVPLHSRRMRQRGFNQSMELARPVKKILGIEIFPDVCVRTCNTASQSTLDARDRRRNVRDVFALKKPIPGKHIAIVDDVVTTGSTVNELARVLRRGGAETIEVWSIARADV